MGTVGSRRPVSSRWRPTVLAVTVALMAASALAACSSAPVPVVTVPLTVENGRSLIAHVTVAGRPLRLSVDTGSEGIRLNGSTLPPGLLDPVGPADPAGVGDLTLTGQIARARVGVGSFQSGGTVPVEVVTGIACSPTHPSCEHGSLSDFFGVDGILGLSPEASRQLADPLWALGDVGHAFVVHVDPAGPSLTLGAPAEGFATQQLRPLQRPGPAGDTLGEDVPPNWSSRVPLCIQAPGAPEPVCANSLVDTGDPSAAAFRSPTPFPATPAGTPVTITVPDRSWSTVVVPRRDGGVAVSRADPGSPGNGIIGQPVLAGVDVRYDLEHGTIGFRPHPR